ncbi:MAG: diguanylate cyclase [Planctomycetota bacterium]|nr:diguanylate cyclase [Planctomycetota bacterium]
MIQADVHDPIAIGSLAIVVLLSAAVASFMAGVLFERRSVERTIQNARQSIGRLFSIANQQLNRAAASCSALERLPEITLSPSQRELFVDRQSRLGESLKRILDRARETMPLKNAKLGGKSVAVQWVNEPLESGVELPDRSAFEANLLQLLEACRSNNASGGVGLIRIDQLERIATRFGEERLHEIRRLVAEIVASVLPESSCQCVFADDTFAVLQPNIDTTELIGFADKIRQSVRTHQFRSEETGVEILVTASFGFCALAGNESPAMLRSRCTEALARSAHRGRNQLHCHDGERLIECSAGRDLELSRVAGLAAT